MAVRHHRPMRCRRSEQKQRLALESLEPRRVMAASVAVGAGIGVGAASAVLAVFSAPLTPIALATAGLGLVSGTVIPGAEWLLDWRDGRSGAEANGLHYLLRA